jgi:hypothetical protein
MNGLLGICRRLFDDLAKGSLEFRAFEADGGGFDGQSLRAKGFNFKPIVFKLFCDLGENHHLLGPELDQKGHEQSLALDLLHLTLAENFLK